MLRLEQDNTIKLFNIEANIIKAKELKHKIEVLEAEFARLKDQLINEHFQFHDEFVGSEGLVMATYKEQNRSQFLMSEFKKDHEKLHADYSVKIPLKIFLIKK
jgi:hypothetical protein